MKSPVLRVMSYAQTWETEMVSTVLLREQDQAGHKSKHFRGKHGFSQGLCRLPTRYVLYVRSSCYISSRFVGEKRESSDSCGLLGFLSNSKILCNVCQSVSLNFRQAAGAAKCPARLRVKAEKAVWRKQRKQVKAALKLWQVCPNAGSQSSSRGLEFPWWFHVHGWFGHCPSCCTCWEVVPKSTGELSLQMQP